jgi:hypothetical protein
MKVLFALSTGAIATSRESGIGARPELNSPMPQKVSGGYPTVEVCTQCGQRSGASRFDNMLNGQ